MTSRPTAPAAAAPTAPADHLARLIADSRFPEADRYATDMLAKGHRGPRMLLMGGRAKAALGDELAALALFREVVARHPQMKARGFLGTANVFLRLGRWDEAEGALEAARAEGLDDAVYWQRTRALASARGDHAGIARAAAALFDHASPRRADLVQIVAAYMHTKDVAALDAAITAADAADPHGVLARLLRAIREELAGNPHVLEPELQRLRAELGGEDGADLLTSELPTARARVLANVERELSRVSALLPATAALKRPALADDPDADVLHADAPGSDVLAIVFTGLADRLTFPLPAFDLFLAEAGIPAIYLRDFDRLLYANGVRSLGGAADTRRRLLDLANGRRIVTVGSSGGSFGALRWGLDLKADRAILFSPVSSIAPASREAWGDERAKLLMRRLYRHMAPADLDLGPVLRDTDHRLRVHVHFGMRNDVDLAQANNLAGIDGVTLHPVDCATHGVLEPLILEGGFSERLRRLIVE